MTQTPKQKAKELVNKFLESLYDNGSLSFKSILYNKAKQCALLAVDEVLNNLKDFVNEEISTPLTIYWLKVKQEIQNL